MEHNMKLQETPFNNIKNGTKTVEFRLFDEKRQLVNIGDTITFSKLPDLKETLTVEVLDLYKDTSFNSLFKKLYTDEEEIERKTNAMLKYYTHEEETKYGVIGIKIKLI